MMWGRLLGLSAILLQVAVFLQPLLPEKQHFSSVCKTVVQALFSDQAKSANPLSADHTHHSSNITASNSISNQTITHSAQHQDSSEQDSHANHECEYCLVYSFALPLLDTKLRYVLIRTQIRVLAFKTAFTSTLFQSEPFFFLPQSRAPPSVL